MSTLIDSAPVSSRRLALPRDGKVIGGISDRLAGGAALLAGGISVVIGVLQLVFPQNGEMVIDPRTRVILALFAVSLCALGVLYLGLARWARSTWGAAVATVGAVLLAIGMVTSAVNGQDLSFFPIIAMVANLMWLVGAIALAVSLVRAGRVSRWFAVLLPVLQLLLIFGSQFGGGIPAGVFLLVLGGVLVAGRIASRRV